MTYAIQELVIRSIAPVDTTEIIDLVTAAMWNGPVARWLNVDPASRRRETAGYFEIFVEHAIRYGEVYATADADTTGRLTGVALWFPFTSMIPPPADYEIRLKEATGSSFDRMREVDAALDARHPLEPHHYLAFLAVRPDRQNRGIGSALLERHHARLDRAGIPAYVEATDYRARELYRRHGYYCQTEIQLPDDGPPLWTMWRSPMP